MDSRPGAGASPAPGRRDAGVLCVSAAQELGGAEFVLLDTIAVLRARDVSLKVLNLAPAPGGLVRILERQGVEVSFCPVGRFRDPRGAVRFLRAFARNRSGVGMTLANDPRALLYTALGSLVLRRPYAWHVHDLVTGSGPFQRIASRLRPARYIAISSAVQRSLEAHGCPSARIAVIHNAVDVERFHPSVDGSGFRKELGLDDDAFVIGTVTRILPWKAVETVVEAAALVTRSCPRAVFAIVGDVVTDQAHAAEAERYRRSLLALRDRLKLGQRVRFLGRRQDLPRVMAGLDLLVNTAVEEPFGRVLIEAMAAGKPVVATEGGGTPEIVEEGVTGYLVPPRDARAVASRIESLADPRLRARLGTAGRARAVARFSLVRYGDEMESVVARVLSRAW